MLFYHFAQSDNHSFIFGSFILHFHAKYRFQSIVMKEITNFVALNR